jgi:hypothetical protein
MMPFNASAPLDGSIFQLEDASVKFLFDKNTGYTVTEKGSCIDLADIYWELYEQATGRTPDDAVADGQDSAIAEYYRERCRYHTESYYLGR